MNAEEFDEWVEIAEKDWLAALRLRPNETPEAICYHCQQCLEKYLKAALLRYNLTFPRTHDLVLLNDNVADTNRRFRNMRDDLDYFNPYAVDPRYPGPQISESDAKEAVEKARGLRKKIRTLLGLEDNRQV